MVTQSLFFVFVFLLAIQRLLELRLSKKNEQVLRAKGGVEFGAGHFKVMKLLHVSWFVSMLLEVVLFDRPFNFLLAFVAFLLVLVGQTLRYSAILTLGWRWTVNVITLPGAPPVSGGIYRYLRHPNYVGVILEILAVPLLHSAFLTAIVFTIANALLLRVRINVEEQALGRENDYETVFREKPRFFPRLKF